MTPTLAAPSILATLPIYQGAVSNLRVVTNTVTDQSADQIESDVFLGQAEGLYAYSFDLVYDQEKVELVMQDTRSWTTFGDPERRDIYTGRSDIQFYDPPTGATDPIESKLPQPV